MYRPKVGEECWLDWPFGEHGIRAEITYISDEVGCYKNLSSDEIKEYTFATGSVVLRSLKSKRDEEIEEMVNVMLSSCGIGERINGGEELSESLHNAGYRKQIPYDDFYSVIYNHFRENLGMAEQYSKRQADHLAAKLNRTPDEDK